MNPISKTPAPACPRIGGILSALLLAAGSTALQAASYSWDGTTGSYDDGLNWSADVVPIAADILTLANGGTIQINSGVLAPATGALGNITATSGTLSVGGGTLTTSGIIANGATGLTTISSGSITGSAFGSFGVATNGSLSNTAVGGTWSISGGTVNLNGISATNGGNQTISGGIVKTLDFRNAGGSTVTISGGTTTIGKFTVGSSGTGTVIVSGTGVVNQNITGQNASGSNNELWIGNNASTGALTLKDDAQLNYSFYNANSSVNFGRGAGNHVFTIQDDASFTTVAGTGALKAVVVGDTNIGARGTVNLDGGTITVLGFAKGTGTGVINANGGLVKAAGNNANFFSGFTGTGGAANTSNSVNVLGGGLKFDSNSFAVTISSVLSGAGGLTKQGAGKLTLSAANTYLGGTTIEDGELHLAAGSSVAGGVAVNAGATLSGFGTIGGNTTIAGIHSVGASPGLQTFSSGLEYLATGVLNWELVADSTADRGLTTGYDAINVTGGTLTVASGATINLVFNAAGSTTDFTDLFWASNQSWQVIDLTGTDGGGSFTIGSISLDANALSSAGFGNFTTSNVGGDHFVNWIAVPEPSAAFLGSLGMIALLRRRRISARHSR